MLDIKEENNAVTIKVRVQPRSVKNQICGLMGDALKIKLTAPPVDGEANKELQQYLAKVFKVAKSQVEIISGLKGRSKTVRINGINTAQAKKLLSI